MKKLLAFILFATVLLSVASVCVVAEDRVLFGDADSDGRVTLFDISCTLKYAAKWDMSKHAPKFSIKAADVTQDGIVNTLDAVKILKYIAGWGPMLLADPQA